MDDKIMMGINLKVRNLENHLNMVLNDYKDVPIEIQRIIVGNILEKLTCAADKVTQYELNEYNRLLSEYEQKSKELKEEQNQIQEE